MTQDDYISWKNWIPMSGGCATAQARKDRCACTHRRGVRWLVRETLLDQNPLGWWFVGVSLSPGPCKAEINVFSECLSENDRKSEMKEFINFAVPCSFLPELQISFFLHGEGSRGHILTRDTQWHTPGTPWKSAFSDWKRPKEGERVALHHFHERGDESPRQDENFEPSGAPVAFFVSEIWPFEVDFPVRSNST